MNKSYKFLKDTIDTFQQKLSFQFPRSPSHTTINMLKNPKMNPIMIDAKNKVKGNSYIESAKLSKYLLIEYAHQIFNLYSENILLKSNNTRYSLTSKIDHIAAKHLSTSEYLQVLQ